MNEPQTRNPDQEVKISSHVIAAPMIKRMVAFTMDLILLLLLLLLTATLLLKFSNPEVSAQLDNLSQEFYHCSKSKNRSRRKSKTPRAANHSGNYKLHEFPWCFICFDPGDIFFPW